MRKSELSPERKAKRARNVSMLLVIGAASLVTRAILSSPLSGSALLYVATPYALALVIAWIRPYNPNTKWQHKYLSLITNTLVVFLASSLILMEGFICVLLFMPILLLVMILAFLTEYLLHRGSTRSRHFGFALPVIIFVSALEGSHASLSLPRDESVTVSRLTVLSPSQLRHHVAMPIDLNRSRHWFLHLFPMPYEIQSDDFLVGADHVAKTRYHRWFFGNTHEGEIRLEITELSMQRIGTRVVSDTSYFSNYLMLYGTEIEFRPRSNTTTEVEVTVHYRRDLDPAWYFAPMQRFAIRQMAELIIREVIIRESNI